MYRNPPANAHGQSQRAWCTKTWKFVNLYFSCQAHGNHACMHLCVLFMCMCQFLCVYAFAFVCIGCQMWRAGRGRGYMVGGGFYLFITQWPPWFQGDMATLVLGPLALVWLWPALALPKPSAFTFSALCSCLFLLFFCTWILFRLSLLILS